MKVSASLLFLCFGYLLSAQHTPVWQDVTTTQMQLPVAAAIEHPVQEYRTLRLDLAQIREQVRTAPEERSVNIQQSTLLIDIPLPNGSTETYRVLESSVMAPALQARYPQIRSYRAMSIEDASRGGRFDISPNGFRGVFQTRSGEIFIDPYASAQTEYYLVYFTNNVSVPDASSWKLDCGFMAEEDDRSPLEGMTPDAQVNARTGGDPLPLRVYSLALTCTGEYGKSHGNSVEGVLASMNTALNRLNEIFEKEVAIRLQLIAQNDQLIFLDKDTDPFTNANNGTGLLGQIENAIVNVGGVPLGGFDLGHLFTNGCTDVGGVVNGRACTDGKMRGVTCHYTSNIDAIVRRVMAHEIGHQFNVAHSWSNCDDDEPETPENEILGQLVPGSAYEPGSGSTIMSYAGSCGTQNVQFDNNDYYHVHSLQQFFNYTRVGNASGCATLMDIGNTEPEITLDYEDGFYIPISTPFELDGQATDMEDEEMLTYCWEQYNLGPLIDLGSPAGSSPSFRSFPPTTSSSRVFPRWDVILTNSFSKTEVLPTYSRDLSFRLTVRDNHPMGSAAVWEQVDFQATDEAGPFLVLSPDNGNEFLAVGSYVPVTWDVANTDQAPVNCERVNIRMSVDGGYTYPFTLLSDAPNNGEAFVTIPDAITTEARIRVEAADNIFFDVSDANFTVIPPTAPTFTLGYTPLFQQLCLPATADVVFNSGSILDFDTTITLTVTQGLPAGAIATFDRDTLIPGESAVLMLDFTDVTFDGDLQLEVRAVAGTDTTYRNVYLELVDNDFSNLMLISPEDGATGINLSTDFSWTPVENATRYNFQLATSPAFGESIIEEVNGLTAPEYSPSVLLENNTLFYWRIQAVNECGPADFLEPFTFHTINAICSPSQATDTPVGIPGTGPLPTRESIIAVPFSGTISDLNLPQIKVNYQPVNSLKVSLISPAGTEVVLFNQNCGNTNTIDLGFDDEAPNAIICAPDDGIVFRPVESLAAFNGENSQGEWILRVEVLEGGFGSPGDIVDWRLEFCATANPVPPVVVTNDTLKVPPGLSNPISNDLLQVEDPDNGPEDLYYTVVTPPQNGILFFQGQPLSAGDQFRQLSIDNLNVSYIHSDNDTEFDFFTFVVQDGTGGFIPSRRFNIAIDENAPVSTSDPYIDLVFGLSPNPATDWVRLQLPDATTATTQVRLLNINGQLLRQHTISVGSQEWLFSTHTLPAGVYLVQAISEGKMGVQRLVVE